MWGAGAVWKRGRTAKELFIYATPMDLNVAVEGPNLSLHKVNVCK